MAVNSAGDCVAGTYGWNPVAEGAGLAGCVAFANFADFAGFAVCAICGR